MMETFFPLAAIMAGRPTISMKTQNGVCVSIALLVERRYVIGATIVFGFRSLGHIRRLATTSWGLEDFVSPCQHHVPSVIPDVSCLASWSLISASRSVWGQPFEPLALQHFACP